MNSGKNNSIQYLQQLAIHVYSTNFQEKINAEQQFKQFISGNLSSQLLTQIFMKGSQQLLFVFVQMVRRQLSKFKRNELYQMYTAIKFAIAGFFDHESCTFRRFNIHLNCFRDMPTYIHNSISLLLGQFMKYINLRIIENNKSEYIGEQIKRFLKTIDIVGEKSDEVFGLYVWKCYAESVSTIDHQLSFSSYRDLSNSFQKYVIVEIITLLVSDCNKYLQDIESQIDIKEIEALQENLTLEENQLRKKGASFIKNMRESSQRIKEYSKIIKKNSKVDFLITLLHIVASYPYNIVYTEYEASQNIFDTCSISFPEEVSEKIIQQNFIATLIKIISKFLNIMENCPKYDLGNTKEINAVWDAFNKFIMMRVHEFSPNLIQSFYFEIITGIVNLAERVQTMTDVPNIEISKQPYLVKIFYKLLKLTVETYKNININIDVDKILEINEKKFPGIFEKYIQTFQKINARILRIFPIYGDYNYIHELCLSFWSQFQKEQSFVPYKYQGFFSLSMYYQEPSQKTKSTAESQLERAKQIACKSAYQSLSNFLYTLFEEGRSRIMGNQIKDDDLSLQTLEEYSQNCFEGIQNLFLFGGCNNYKILTEMWIFQDRRYFFAKNNKNSQTNFIFLCAHLLNKYPDVQKHIRKYSNSDKETPHLQDALTLGKLTFKMIYGYLITSIGIKSMNKEFTEEQHDHLFEYSCVIFVYRFIYELLTHLTYRISTELNQNEKWGINDNSKPGKYHENYHYLYNSKNSKEAQKQIIIVSKADLFKDLNFNAQPNSPFAPMSQKINQVLDVSLSILTPTFYILPQSISFLSLINPNTEKGLEGLLIWCFSYMVNCIKKYTDLAFYSPKNTYLISLLNNLYTKLHSLVCKFKWNLHRDKYTKTLTGKYLLEVIKMLMQQTINNINNSAVMLESDSKQIIAILQLREKLMKIVAVLMFDDIHDDYEHNIELIVSFIHEIYQQAKEANSYLKYLNVLHDLIGIFETIDTAKIWKYFVISLNKTLPLVQVANSLYVWALGQSVSDLKMLRVKEKIVKNVIKLQKLIINNKCHRISGPHNVVKNYEFIAHFIPHWIQILTLFLEGAKNNNNGGARVQYKEAILHVFCAFDSIIKSGNINFSILVRYQPKFRSFWELFFRCMPLALADEDESSELAKYSKQIFEQFWKNSIIEYLLNNSTSETISNFRQSFCLIMAHSITLADQKIQENNAHDIEVRLQSAFESLHRTLKLIVHYFKYKHRPTLIEVIKYFISELKQAKTTDYLRNSCMKIEEENLIDELFLKTCRYLLMLLTNNRRQIYFVKMLCSLLLVFGSIIMDRETVSRICEQKLGNNGARLVQIVKTRDFFDDESNAQEQIVNDIGEIKEYFLQNYLLDEKMASLMIE